MSAVAPASTDPVTAAAIAGNARSTRALGWVRLVHAFPVATVTVATAGVAWGSGGNDAGAMRVAVVTLAMFFGQCSVGIQNDYLDRFRDAAMKPRKPIPAGLVHAEHARVAWVACLLAFVALNVPLGLQALAVGVAALSAGFAYNQGLKFSPFGFLAYVAGFSLLGIWVWVATDAVRPELLWALAFAPPMLAGLGIINAVPDVAADKATGVRTLATAIGRERAVLVSWGLFAAGLVVMLLGMLAVDVRVARLAVPAGASLLAAGLGIACSATGRDWPAFRCYGIGTAVALVGWLAAAG